MLNKLVMFVAFAVASTLSIADADKTGNYERTTTVQVQASGASIEEAKKQGFRKAIEEAVGSVMLSSKESQGDQLTKDQINEYSAGYIDYYEVLDSHQDENRQWVVDMKVRVASSKIAMRMLSSSNSVTRLDGERFKAALESQLETRKSGDALLNEVLSSYPENAYIVNQGVTEMRFNQYRQSELNVPLTIKMSQFWLAGFDEALSVIAVDPVPPECSKFLVNLGNLLRDVQRALGPAGTGRTHNGKCSNENVTEPDIRITYKQGNSWGNTSHSYNVPDKRTLELINSHIAAHYIGLFITAYYMDGTTDTVCNRIPTSDFLTFVDPKGIRNMNEGMKYMRPDITGNQEFTGSLTLTFSDDKLGKIEKLDLRLQKEC